MDRIINGKVRDDTLGVDAIRLIMDTLIVLLVIAVLIAAKYC